MAESNGDKSKIIMFLVGVLQTIILGWCWWIGAGVVEAKTNIAELRANYASISKQLDDIKQMLRSK